MVISREYEKHTRMLKNSKILIVPFIILYCISGDYAIKCFVCDGFARGRQGKCVDDNALEIVDCDKQPHKFSYPYFDSNRWVGCRKVVQISSCRTYVRINRGEQLVQTYCDCIGELCNGHTTNKSPNSTTKTMIITIVTTFSMMAT